MLIQKHKNTILTRKIVIDKINDIAKHIINIESKQNPTIFNNDFKACKDYTEHLLILFHFIEFEHLSEGHGFKKYKKNQNSDDFIKNHHYVNIHFNEKFSKIIPKNLVKPLLNYLKDFDMININSKYKKNEWSKGYKITPTYLYTINTKYQLYQLKSKPLYKKLHIYHSKKEQQENFFEESLIIKNNLSKLKLNDLAIKSNLILFLDKHKDNKVNYLKFSEELKNAKKESNDKNTKILKYKLWVLENIKTKRDLITLYNNKKSIDKINSQDFYCVKDKDAGGRLYHNFCNLDKNLLIHLEHIDGRKDFYEVDCQSSQPNFLYAILSEQNVDKNEMMVLKNELETKDFYLQFERKSGDRAKLKKQFMNFIFNNNKLRLEKKYQKIKKLEELLNDTINSEEKEKISKEIESEKNREIKNNPNQFEKEFSLKYPNLMKVINDLKENNHSKFLSEQLRMMESKIFIKIMVNFLNDKGIEFITKHDSIIFLGEKNVKLVKEKLLYELEKVLGYFPQLHIKPLVNK